LESESPTENPDNFCWVCKVSLKSHAHYRNFNRLIYSSLT